MYSIPWRVFMDKPPSLMKYYWTLSETIKKWNSFVKYSSTSFVCGFVSERYHMAYKLVKTECKLVRSILNAHGLHEVRTTSSGLSLALVHKHVKMSVGKFTFGTTRPHEHVKKFWKYSKEEDTNDILTRFKNIEETNQITINIKFLSCTNTW